MGKDGKTDPAAAQHALIFELTGRVESSDFPEWIERHARKLGVRCLPQSALPRRLRIKAIGPEVMTHAFALACSLGPKSVYVESLAIISSETLTEFDEISCSSNANIQP